MKRNFFRVLLGVCSFFPFVVFSQSNLAGQNLGIPTSAVPFLNFTPDARSGALGEAGVALGDPDANAIFWNPSKLVFAKQSKGASISYTPWLRELIGDMYYTYLSGYSKIGKNSVIGGSLMYFDLGTVNFTTATGVAAGTFNSREYAVTATFSQRLSQNFSLGVDLKYLNSNLASGSSNPGLKPGGTAAADISAFYRNEARDNATGRGLGWAFGGMISNLGGRINYGGQERYFIPTNLRLGTALTYYVDQYNKFNIVADVNKLMVPTPPEYARDASGNLIPIAGSSPTKYQIAKGQDPDRNYFSAVFGSFADAPGGFSEELREFTISTGIEYWYNEQFAVRAGYFGESNTKGGRKYFTTGIGLRLQERFGVDFSYLLPVKQGNPLANTFRISLLFNFNGSNAVGSEDDEPLSNDSNN
ncbi:type IX secretion system outer membrane channel protein PorV [Spirosoma endbachense]|uniref:Type IX secretion system outer membrane channel protein PorV n=1 Tax=Spirosoma endbachense TaxID=2666025 RepID=A0A6P1W272_9BACT|nr:type IX secretion system outer membrane channel protein PorV [Spirosoma endbachense]QHV98117.1 type IX secretion system outer membrane channel protein PorV [Spirosoma endbachense]